MKKITKILITLLIIIAAAASGLLIWQHDNISALMSGLSSSSEDLAVKMDDQRNKLKSEVEKYVSEPIEDISAEDEEKLLKGEITVEEIADKYNLPLDYMKDNGKETSDYVTGLTGPVPGDNFNLEEHAYESNSGTADGAIGDSVSKMYALKAKYVNKLGELERKVFEEYKNLPEEKQNKDSKYSLVMKNMNYAADLEQKCDSEVAAVLSNLEAELKKYNGDKEIIQILQNAYEEEKKVKKAYYLSLYNN